MTTEMTPEQAVLSDMGIVGDGAGGYQYADNSQQSFTGGQEEAVKYDLALDLSSIWGGPTAEDEQFFRKMGADAPKYEEPKDWKAWIKDNDLLAKMGFATGAGLLKSLSQQQMLEEQRDWQEKTEKEAWQRKMKANAYARHTPQMSGLLAQTMAQRGAK